MDATPALEAIIRERAGRLDTFASHIMGCRVVVQPAGKHHRHGNQYEVRLDITVPRDEILSTREPGQHVEYKELEVAIRDAFDSATRQLEDYVRRQRRDVKHTERIPHAKVSKLVPAEDYGFVTTPEGREIYFHRNSVLYEAFDDLHVGTEVAYVEEEGEKGPQASTVKMVGRHGGI
jgi:cold shock CspA family protein